VKDKLPPPSFLKYSGLGLQLLVSIGLAAWAGLKLDQYLKLKFPAFLMLFVFSAFAGSLYIVYRSLNKE